MIIISFLLDGLLSNFLSFPLFTLTSLIISSYYKQEETILKYSLIIGVIYDIIYTNTLILNALIFYFIILFVLKIKQNNFKNMIIIYILSLLIYIIFTYFILVLFRYINFDIIYFLTAILKALIINIIYFLILYFIKHKKLFKTYI